MVSADRIQVTLTGGAPWGFRLSGGGGLPLIINKIRKKSQAHVQGLKEGDAVISINGVHVHDKTQDEALELVEAAGDSLTLEIFRGDKDEATRDKPKIHIPVVSSGKSQTGTIRLVTTSDDGISPGEVILIPSGDSVTSASLDTKQGGGVRVKVVADAKPSDKFSVASAYSSSGHTTSIPVKDIKASSSTAVLNKSPVISVDVVRREILSTVAAEPYFDSPAKAPSPSYLRQSPPQYRQLPPGASSKSYDVSSQATHVYNSQFPPSLSPQPPRSPHGPPVSPKPTRSVSPQPPSVILKPPGVASSVASSTFDDGRTHREVTREQLVQRSDDGKSTTVVQRETTTTTTGRPSFVKNQTSAFNAVQPREEPQHTHRSHKTTSTTTTRKSTTTNIQQKGPTPFVSSTPTNVLQLQFQASTPTISRSNDSQYLNSEPPMFKPTKFVPGSGKKDTPGLYTPASPLADFKFKDGKENVSPPQPMFQVTNIVSEKAKSAAQEIWRPNMWLPGQKPTSTQEQSHVTTARDDFSPQTASTARPGYSLVEEQKRKLMALQTPKNELDGVHNQENQDSSHGEGHNKHERLHIFAPPVEMHADLESPYYCYEDQYHMDDYDDGPSSPDSFGGRRKKKLYGDSAFYDTPGKSYPTITDQMKLCKTIAQSLTSAANRRARGAKMFMKRKRKSSKWIHEGHSELSSSGGDVANLHELDSELAAEEGGNKPLLYFKIPNIKNRIGNEAKQTKMALTQEQFEKLRLSSKKCDHKTLAPDPCFDIVADLKAHKGRGGRLFERRKQRSDKFVIDESNAKFALPHGNSENSPQSSGHHLTPREVALKHGWKGDATSSQNALTAFLPVVHTSLKSDESPCLLKGKDFNRRAKGWSGGGEYPVAERLQHISPTRQPDAPQPPSTFPQYEQQNNKINAWQTTRESSVSRPVQDWPRSQQDVRQDWPRSQQDVRQDRPRSQQDVRQDWPRSQQDVRQDWPRSQQDGRSQDYRQPRRQDDLRGKSWGEQRPHQEPRPKSWQQPESYDSQKYRDGSHMKSAPVDYSQGSRGYPTVAYKQPIIPGTDL